MLKVVTLDFEEIGLIKKTVWVSWLKQFLKSLFATEPLHFLLEKV